MWPSQCERESHVAEGAVPDRRTKGPGLMVESCVVCQGRCRARSGVQDKQGEGPGHGATDGIGTHCNVGQAAEPQWGGELNSLITPQTAFQDPQETLGKTFLVKTDGAGPTCRPPKWVFRER